MKILITSVCAATFAAALVQAAPADDLAAAARKLGDAANYSWTTTTEMANAQFTPGPVTGQTEKGGYTVVTREFNGNSMQTVRKGEQFVMQNQQGEWMTMEEMREQFANRGGGNRGGGQGGGGNRGGGPGGGRGGFGGFGGGQADPATEAVSLAAKLQDAKTDDGAIVGTLSAADAAPLLAFGGGMGGRGGRGGRGGSQGGGGGDGGGRGGNPPPAPKNVSATVSYWIKDGVVTKFAISVKGTVTTPSGDEREVARTMTTEFKEIGTTKVIVPDAAKQKLGA